ncbi:MAG: ExbD/TolR family protein [Planctomycetota bacterium]
MPLRRRERLEAEINVGAFADIAFLLIIFFILATTLIQLRGQELDIPAGKEQPQEAEQTWPTVSIDTDAIRWGEQAAPVDMDALRAKLAGLNLPDKDPDERFVVLNAAPGVSYQRYFRTVLAISKAGGVLAIIDRDKGRAGSARAAGAGGGRGSGR